MDSRPASPGDAPTRPPSLWPESTRAGQASAHYEPTHFDAEPGGVPPVPAGPAPAALDLCHPALALRALLMVQAALVPVALAEAGDPTQWLGRHGSLAFGGVAATGLWALLVCAASRLLQRRGPAVRAAWVVAAGAGSALAVWWALAWMALVRGGAWQGGAVAAGSALLALALWVWLELRSRAQQPAVARARLAELQSRIRPHFLFNTLNSALALVRADPARAEAVLEDLAELFRAALAEGGSSVALADEVQLARRYLDIEAVRFGPRLQVHWQLDAATDAAQVPPLVLQPLVENAVRHGVEPQSAGGQVWVQTRLQRGQVWVTVVNTLGPDDAAPNPGQGMALANVRERLHLLHDLAAQCDTWRAAGPDGSACFHARVVVPAP